MSDARLQELERTYRESPTAEAARAWFHARLHARDPLSWDEYRPLAHTAPEVASACLLEQQRLRPDSQHLRLAAILGHEPAQVAYALPIPPVDLAAGDLKWIQEVAVWDQGALQENVTTQLAEAGIRAGVAILRRLLHTELSPSDEAQTRASVELGERAIDEGFDDYPDPAFLYEIARRHGATDPFRPARCLAKCFLDRENGLGAWIWGLAVAATSPYGSLTPENVLSAVRADLLPWILRFFDPVRAGRGGATSP